MFSSSVSHLINLSSKPMNVWLRSMVDRRSASSNVIVPLGRWLVKLNSSMISSNSSASSSACRTVLPPQCSWCRLKSPTTLLFLMQLLHLTLKMRQTASSVVLVSMRIIHIVYGHLAAVFGACLQYESTEIFASVLEVPPGVVDRRTIQPSFSMIAILVST